MIIKKLNIRDYYVNKMPSWFTQELYKKKREPFGTRLSISNMLVKIR